MNRLGFVAIGLLVFAFAGTAYLLSSASATPGGGTLYGTDAGAAGLYTINTTSGVGTFVGSMSMPDAPALAGDPITGGLYGGTGGTQNDLYLVNQFNGMTTLIGNGGLGSGGYTSFDFDDTGLIYAAANLAGGQVSGSIAGTGGDHLVTVNKTTGVATVVGTFGTCTGHTIPVPASGGNGSCTIEGMDAIAFDAAGNLWGALNTRGDAGAPGLYTINKLTGAATFVAVIDDSASGLHPSGGVVSLQFHCDGTLYGGTARRQAPSLDGGMLGRINTTTGQFTFISSSPITTGNPANSLGGLASLPSTCPTPTPSPSATPSPTPTPNTPTPTPSPTPTPNTPTPTPNTPTPTPTPPITGTPTATGGVTQTPFPSGTPPVGGLVDVVTTGSGGSSSSLPWALLIAVSVIAVAGLTGSGFAYARVRD